MMRVALLLLPALALSACDMPGGGEGVGEGEAGTAQPSATTASGSADPSGSKPVALQISEDTELYSFDFAYPAEVAAIPELKDRFDLEMAETRDQLVTQATEAQAEARDQGFPYNAYAEGRKWQVVADTPRFLSLSATVYSYTGGAHPISGTRAMVWDRETKRAVAPVDFFASAAALDRAVRDPYCSALDKERDRRRGAADEGSLAEFGECPAMTDLTVLLGSSNGRVFDRIGLVADPYVAGPYAEGDYDITVPVTAEVLEAVRPTYRNAFAAR